MMTSSDIPVMKRARGYRLYGQDGKRYIDFYQNGGRAILGHKPGRLVNELKNILEKGLIAENPSCYTERLGKAVSALLPGYPGFRVYGSTEEALLILNRCGILPKEEIPFDPARPEKDARESSGVSWWRPFLEEVSLPPVVLPVLPFPARFLPAVVCFSGIEEKVFPPSHLCSPLLLGGLVRTVYDLKADIGMRDRSVWQEFDLPFWTRIGPYLTPKGDGGISYKEMYNDFLAGGILLNPDPAGVSIIPEEYSPGEVKYIHIRERKYGSQSDS